MQNYGRTSMGCQWVYEHFWLYTQENYAILTTKLIVVMSFTASQTQEIRETLAQIGLSDQEQRAYMTLLELGVVTATPLAQALSIPLTTAQSLLQRLAKRGIVHVSKRKTRSVYEAKDPVVFKNLLEQSLRDIGGVIPLLRSLKADEVTPAKIRVYQRDRVTDIFRQALTSKEKLVYEIVSARSLQALLGERFHFSRRRVEAGVRLKSLRVEAHELKKYSGAQHQRELREAKFLPREFCFTATVLFWDATVALLTDEKEGGAVIIQSAALALMMRQVFDLLWSVSRKMETA